MTIESKDDPVTVIVGSRHDEIVRDPTKDVLVKYYAPWCKHCTKLVPVWEELGAQYANEKDLVIASFNCDDETAASLNIDRFPTLVFYPKDKKWGVNYDGPRNVEGFTNYLNESSSVLHEKYGV